MTGNGLIQGWLEPVIFHSCTMTESIFFYKFLVNSQVFYKSKHTYALVNLKPLVPGHVLVVPFRTEVLRFADLTPEESVDYMNTLQVIHKLILKAYKADSMNLAIQDGPESGQSVPHLHTHIIPRFKKDALGESVHSKLEAADLKQQYEEFFERREAFKTSGKWTSVKDEDRVPRTPEIMEQEAQWLREQLEEVN